MPKRVRVPPRNGYSSPHVSEPFSEFTEPWHEDRDMEDARQSWDETFDSFFNTQNPWNDERQPQPQQQAQYSPFADFHNGTPRNPWTDDEQPYEPDPFSQGTSFSSGFNGSPQNPWHEDEYRYREEDQGSRSPPGSDFFDPPESRRRHRSHDRDADQVLHSNAHDVNSATSSTNVDEDCSYQPPKGPSFLEEPDRRRFPRDDEESLRMATHNVLNPELFPIGSLTERDVDEISRLMAAWAWRRTLEAAMTVDKLLDRVIADMKVGNPAASVDSAMYNYVSSFYRDR